MDLIAECPDSFPETLELPGGGAAVLRLHRTEPGWYGSIPLRISNQHLADGVALRTVGFALVLHGSLLHVLSQDPNVGGWSSVRQVDPMEEHMLVVHETVTGAVRAFLDEYANQGWSIMVRQVEGLPPEWQIYQGVRIERPPDKEIRGFLSVLVPSLRSRACLWGGLPIGRLKATYLTGGEPAVLIPTEGEEVRAVDVVLDSNREKASSATGIMFLHGRELAAGEHYVAIGPTDLHFSLIEGIGIAQPAGTGAIGHLLKKVGDGSTAISLEAGPLNENIDGVRRVVGGAVLDEDPSSLGIPRPVVVLREASRYLLLGARPGEIDTPVPPRVPGWINTVGLNATCYEVYPAFRVVWVLSLRKMGWTARLSQALPVDMTEPFEASNARVVDWSLPFQQLPSLLAPGEDGAELWTSYCVAVDEYMSG
jgi:hypothetical protein